VPTLFRLFLPTDSYPGLSPSMPLIFRQNLFCPFLQFCWKIDISNNKKDKAFLLVEIWIAIQRDFSHCFHAQVYYNPNWFISTWPLQYFCIDLCHFNVTVLAPLHWGHETLSSFGFPTYPHTSCMCSTLCLWPKSNNITVFALDLKSAYEGEHMIFGLMSLANLAQDDSTLFLYPFPFNWYQSADRHCFIFLSFIFERYCFLYKLLIQQVSLWHILNCFIPSTFILS
jgi:hypothetical protein